MTRTHPSTADDLPPAHKRAVLLAIVALHGLAGWALLQVAPVRAALAQAAPMMVDLLAPPAPEPLPEPPAPPPPPQPVAKKPPPPAPVVVAAAPPAPAPFVVPEAPPEPAPLPPPPPPVEVPPAPPAPAPLPREIPPEAIRYLEPPAPDYPRLSRRLNERGLVVVRVFVDADGLPRTVQIAQSSGFARLDEAALEGVRRARFRPYAENGRPSAGWARIPIPFELEN